ncbi:MAG: hypothetical protein ACE5J5_05890 [Candidatus Hydrothermarchaeales archaeon]
MPKSRCVVCGKTLLVGEICKECEVKTLKEVRAKAHILSTITTIIFLLIISGVWWVYGPVVMEMDTTSIGSYSFAFETSFEILKSPKLFPLALVGLILIVFALLFGHYSKKIFLDSVKSYLT